MYEQAEIDKLKLLTGEKNEELLSLLLDEAEAFVLAYTNRTRLVPGLKKPVRDLAVIALNRMGTEGEPGAVRQGRAILSMMRQNRFMTQ